MHAALDVHYDAHCCRAACVGFDEWAAQKPVNTWTVELPEAGKYEPGQFYRRELDPILQILEVTGQDFETLVIDAYCELDEAGTPGLGVRLADSVGSIQVIGVAKNRFRKTTHAHELLRGDSERPLFVTAVGLAADHAAQLIASMHGPHRLPTLLKAADHLARGRDL